ncbi:hypothetical protein [Actinomadura roseirufa]|uniref:hypothetical protein n=1 Tax=Actinomadura roseirufa TaxID=2094049 RepID=UPI0010410EFD|nr:hypothetical protein [Actinomadura roseirufa]
MSDAYERLDELATLLTRRFSDITPRRLKGARILYLLSAGQGTRNVIWNQSAAEYAWYGDPGHGTLLGTTAEQAAEEIGRTLGLSTAP